MRNGKTSRAAAPATNAASKLKSEPTKAKPAPGPTYAVSGAVTKKAAASSIQRRAAMRLIVTGDAANSARGAGSVVRTRRPNHAGQVHLRRKSE